MSTDLFIVEDEPELAALVADYARAAGYHATVFGDGALALDAIRRQPPALVVLDLMLPGLDGLSVCRAVRTGAWQFRRPADRDGDGAGRGDRPPARPGAGRRRLPVQALQPARADGAHQGDPAAGWTHSAAAAPASTSTRPRAASASTAARWS
jgi:CheY-like chemotaxis protein